MIFTGFFKKKNSEVKLGFSSVGKVMADSNSYLFSIESIGKASEKGFLISFSGEAVDSGSLKLDKIELHRLKGVKFEITKYGLKKVEKKEGGFAYQLSLKNFYIPERESESASLLKFGGNKDKASLSRIENEIQFKLSVSYDGTDESEVLIGVFPYENILSGAASKWVTVSPDKDYFKKIYDKK